MWIPVSTVAALFVLFDIADGTDGDNDLEIIFRDRSRTDWEDLWHRERHVRCRESLARHLYWACEKDIYRLTRRSGDNENRYDNYRNSIIEEEYPWIDSRKAYTMLRFRRDTSRRSGTSISAECCSSTGCTWEEYAEYCPTNTRYTLM